MKVNFKAVFLSILTLIYSFLVFMHICLANTKLHIKLSGSIALAQFYSFPTLFGFIMAVIALIVLLVLLRKYIKTKAKSSLFSLICWGIILIFSILFIFLSPVKTKTKLKSSAGEGIKIVEFNTQNNLSQSSFDKIFKDFDADIAVFPELSLNATTKHKSVEVLFANSGVDIDNYNLYSSSGIQTNIAPVTVITKKSLDEYKLIEGQPETTFGTVILQAQAAEQADIIAVHTYPPIPPYMFLWKNDLNIITDKLAKNYPNALIIGDFNANLKHTSLNKIIRHEDALSAESIFKRGTWPSNLPLALRANIDHILLPKDKYKVLDINIKDLENSDHCAIFLEINQ